MTDTYLTISTAGEAIYKDKGSKFLAFACHVQSVDEVKRILDAKRKEFYDARHVCYAYMLGSARADFRANDDGEPSGTAGRPILGQINSASLTDVLIVVVRYFGGTLLGTSGLIQAYKTSAAEAIAASVIEEKIIEKTFEVQCGYDAFNLVMRIVKDFGLTVTGQEQSYDCKLCLRVRLSDEEAVLGRFGKLDFVKVEEV